MLKQLTDVPDGVQALQAMETVSKYDYEKVFAPLVDDAWRAGGRVRLLYECGPHFDRLTLGALWADARLGYRYLRLFDGCAVVSDSDWLRESTQRIGVRMPCPVRVFTMAEHDEALAWLSSLPEGDAPSWREIAAAYVGGVGAAIGWFVTSGGGVLPHRPTK